MATLAAPRPSHAPAFADLLILISIVLCVASVILAIGVFLYVQFLQSQSSSKQAQLERAKQAFEPALIQQLTRLDDRMKAGDKILASHMAPTVFFHVLEQLTLQTVSFSTLDFEANDPQQMTLKMAGLAESVNSVALQADYLSKSGVITSPIFSNIGRQVNGVHFDLSALINPLSVRYSQLLTGGTQVASSTKSAEDNTPKSPFAPSSGASAPAQASTTEP